MASTRGRFTPGSADHPLTPGHLGTCETCQDTLLYWCALGDHRSCHLDPVLECEVSARWLEPVREAARVAVAEHGQRPGVVAVVSRPLGDEGEPTVHGVGVHRSQAVRRLFWNAKRRLGLSTDRALHGRLFYVLPNDDLLPLR